MFRPYTFQDLQTLSLSELHALRGALHRTLTTTKPHSAPAREILASLNIVDRLIRLRTPSGPRM